MCAKVAPALIVSLCIAASQAFVVYNDYDEYGAMSPPPIIPGRFEQREPSQIMVDMSNDLSYKILHLHSILNRNNFAFSPTALMCVVVAVYEGSAGHSSLEIRNALAITHNREVIRVGYRDIHRRLRTYFFQEENPLKGLSLNQENVTITAEYENILKFYGYDLGIDMVSSTDEPTTATVTDETTSMPSTTTMPATTTTTKAMESTTAQTTTDETTTLEPETTTTAPETTTEAVTQQSSDDEANTTETSEETNDSEKIPKNGRTSLYRQGKPSEKLISLPSSKYLPTKNTQSVSKKVRRHLFSGLKNPDTRFIISFIDPRQQFLQAPPPQVDSLPPPLINYLPPPLHYVDTIGPPPPIAPLDLGKEYQASPKDGLNSHVVDHIFYLNNEQVIHTTFKVYNSILYYGYFSHLKMTVLEVELDSDDYNLMIFLPDNDVDIVTATASLRSGPTLRVLRKLLKPRWVQAIIPDFKLKGTMFLTNDLQNMGICDIFEPNRANFRPMTDENGIYVKHIEQTINVNIRTQPVNHLKRSYGRQAQPIQVSVNHPFLFFIIDRDLDVAIMAGRILNPLSVRIQ